MTQPSTEKLEHTGPPKKKRVASMPQREQLASTPGPYLPKGKEQSGLSRAPDCKEGIQCQRSKENSTKGKKETSNLLQKDSESQSKKQSYPNELSENSRKGDVRWGERREKEGWLVELVGDQNPGSEAPPRSKIGRKRKEQSRCQGRSDCQRSDEEE